MKHVTQLSQQERIHDLWSGAVYQTTFTPIVSGVFPVVSMIEKSLNLEGKNFEELLSMRAPPPLSAHMVVVGVTLAFFLP